VGEHVMVSVGEYVSCAEFWEQVNTYECGYVDGIECESECM